jgi:hypothetical protein
VYELRELFQALVGVVLPDYDDYDALLLNAFTSHPAHASTRGVNAQALPRASAKEIQQQHVKAADNATRRASG